MSVALLSSSSLSPAPGRVIEPVRRRPRLAALASMFQLRGPDRPADLSRNSTLTVSRADLRPASRATSRATSRSTSRAASRATSRSTSKAASRSGSRLPSPTRPRPSTVSRPGTAFPSPDRPAPAAIGPTRPNPRLGFVADIFRILRPGTGSVRGSAKPNSKAPRTVSLPVTRSAHDLDDAHEIDTNSRLSSRWAARLRRQGGNGDPESSRPSRVASPVPPVPPIPLSCLNVDRVATASKPDQTDGPAPVVLAGRHPVNHTYEMEERPPTNYENADTTKLARSIGRLLDRVIAHNDAIPLADDSLLTRFHSREPPGISVSDYLVRLTVHTALSPAIVLTVLWYLDQATALYPAFFVSSLTVHRAVVAAVTVASKGISDAFWTNATYARVGGLQPRELAVLEIELLTRLDWRILPPPDRLIEYFDRLDSAVDRDLPDNLPAHISPADLLLPFSPGDPTSSCCGMAEEPLQGLVTQ